jgi:hypothetical protein
MEQERVMSDLMLFGVLRMPIEMAMSDEMSRLQFYARAQEAANRIEELEAENERLRQSLAKRVVDLDNVQVEIEMPQDDNRTVKTWWQDVRNGKVHLCISVEGETPADPSAEALRAGGFDKACYQLPRKVALEMAQNYERMRQGSAYSLVDAMLSALFHPGVMVRYTDPSKAKAEDPLA